MAIPTLAMIPSGYKAGKLYSVLPSDGTGDFTVARNSVATRVNQSGLIEEVGVNVPRLDYSAGGCPVLLTEIQSQNLITYSEDFTQWATFNATITPNSSISPDGTLNASLFSHSGGSFPQVSLSGITFVSGSDYIPSLYVKSDGTSQVQHSLLVNNVVVNFTPTDKWVRISDLIVSPDTSGSFVIAQNSGSAVAASFYIWGAQLEEQPAATSYIKTTGTAQTREADSVNGAGSAATFNSLEHTFFVDLNSMFESGNLSAISIVGSTGTITDNRILIRKETNNTQILINIRSGGQSVAGETLSNIDFSVRQKLAITIKLNEIKYYLNGFLVATDTGTIPLPVSLGEVTLTSGATSFHKLAASTKDIRYYNQVLTAAETLELMSYDSFNEMASALQYTIK